MFKHNDLTWYNNDTIKKIEVLILTEINLASLIDDNSDKFLKNVEGYFQTQLKSVELANYKYKHEIDKLFTFALHTDPSLFPKIKIEEKNENPLKSCNLYIAQWIKKYIDNRANPAVEKPLKNYGQKDQALVNRLAATNMDSNTLSNYLVGHFLYMSAENTNGSILEEYLATVLEPRGWYWCAGTTLRAIDFCYFNENEKDSKVTLLQVKNKYNTENSSSSAIRDGTKIKKWYRLKHPRKASPYTPLPNWATLINLIEADADLASELTEEKYLSYIEHNSTKKIDYLDE
ncbi:MULTISPECIES: SinI family restriction endonuclease [Leuconostoc]|uniref:SinI family restriction endonuclease n=1 Tax=Leuconostoc TaxID=1243 RepID=UPI000A005B3D|nr:MULTISPECIES: SinI family restriction endonuclease [Leuconostoc]